MPGAGRVSGLRHRGIGILPRMMGDPGPCPACETVDLERRGGKDMCPRCHYIQPCCDGGICT